MMQKYLSKRLKGRLGGLVQFALFNLEPKSNIYIPARRPYLGTSDFLGIINKICFAPSSTFRGGKMGKHYWSMVTYGQFVNWLKAFEAALLTSLFCVNGCLGGWVVGRQLHWRHCSCLSEEIRLRPRKLLLKLKNTNKCNQCDFGLHKKYGMIWTFFPTWGGGGPFPIPKNLWLSWK